MSALPKEEFELIHLRAGQAFMLVAPAGGELAFSFVDRAQLPSLEKVLTRSGRSGSVKVVGVGGIVAEVARVAREKGFAVEKEISRSEPFDLLFNRADGRMRVSKPEVKATATPQAVTKRVKVLVVDDSATIRQLLKRMLEEDAGFEVVAAAERPSQVEELIQRYQPDVITLDIYMPEEDGVSLLRRIFPKYRIPTVMVTAIGLQEGRQVLDALEGGAVDYVQKPSFAEISQMAPVLREKIRIAASAQTRRVRAAPARSAVSWRGVGLREKSLILIGASTGGTEAIRQVLTALPEKVPPILIVQHIPPVFSKAFADRMNQLCAFEVLEAQDGMAVQPGRAIIAAGGTQMGVKFDSGQRMKITVDPLAETVNRHKPSVDYLFHSVARLGSSAQGVSVVLTGMGNDGAAGLKGLRDGGWRTIAQDEESSVVFGMPREAIRLGGAEKVVSLENVAAEIVEIIKK